MPIAFTWQKFTNSKWSSGDFELRSFIPLYSKLKINHRLSFWAHGIEYRPGCVLRLREMDDVENDYPVYGQVDEIIVWEDEKFFILTALATLSSWHMKLRGLTIKQLFCAMTYNGRVWSIAYCSKEWQEIYCGEGHMLYWRRTLVDES